MKKLFIIPFLLLISLLLPATDSLSFVNLNVENGLTSNTINCIFKDSKNFIWLGTANGLNRFDGSSILSFDDFKDKSIVDLLEADASHLYVLAEKELYRFDRQTRKNTGIEFSEKKNLALKTFDIDKKGDLYIVGNGELFYLQKGNNTVSAIKNSLLDDKLITDISIKDDICWLTTSKGLIKYNLTSKRTDVYNPLLDEKLVCLTKSDNELYICTQNNNILSFDLSTEEFKPIAFLQDVYIQTISYYNNNIYIGTNGDGLRIINTKNRDISSIVHKPSDTHSISSNAVYSFFIDDNSFWVGTFSGGLNYLPSTSKFFKTLNTSAVFNTSNLNIRSFSIDDKCNGVYGTRNGIIYNNNGNTQWYTTGNTPSLRSNIILSIYPYGDKYLIGTYGGGINSLDTKSKVLKRFHDDPVFSNNSFYSIVEDKEGILWFGTLSGLIKYDPKSSSYTIFDKSNSDIISNDIYTVLRDSAGRIWMGTRNGICYYEEGEIKKVSPLDLSFVGIVRHLFEDLDHNIWLGCENQGAVKIAPDLSSFEHYTVQGILPDNYVSSIAEGKQGQIWMTTPKGIVLYNTNTSEYSIYSIYDGIPSYAFNDGAVHKTANNTLWWGNEKGLIYLDTPDIKSAENNNYFLTKVVIDGYPEDANIRKLKNSPEYCDVIQLPSSQRNFIFRFSDFKYDYPSSIVYEYRIDGLQNTWHKTTIGNDILISDIPSGSYTLRIRKAGDKDSEQTFSITKDKPYTIYWILTSIILLGVVSFFVYKSFIKKLNKYKDSEKHSEESVKLKYQNIKLEKDELENIKQLLEKYMEDEKPFLNPDLKLDDLAKAINCSKTKISQVLNQHLNTNFSHFVAKYRIEMFKKKAEEGLIQQYTLSALAKECGFSSRSSFFHSMKKLTGQTPSEFLKDAGINID